MPVVTAGADELGQGELLDDAAVPVGQHLGRYHRAGQPGGTTSQARPSAGARLLLAVPA